MSAPVSVVLADDHAAIRTGLRLILEGAGIRVVGEASDGAVAVRQARALRPDVVLMDLRMPGTDGVAATRAVVEEGLAEVLVLTSYDLDDLVRGALRAGAAGFLLKSVEPDALVDAVHAVARGDGVLAPEVTRRVLRDLVAAAGPDDAPAPDQDDLTGREREVLAGLGRGWSNAELADRLGISETTAKTHVSRVLAKTGTRTRMQAAVLARSRGLA
ncbi:response regulator transcription factor [Angustibacter speluncae]